MSKFNNIYVAHQGADDGIQEAASMPKHIMRKGEHDVAVTALNQAISGKADDNHGHEDATETESGFMSAADKVKLDALSGNENWRPSVATKAALPLSVDPEGTCRYVRNEKRIYACIAQVGDVDAQWYPMGSLSSVGKYVETIGDGESTVIDVVHNSGSLDVTFSIREVSSGKFVAVDAWPLNSNTIRIEFESAPAVGAYRIVIIA